ncbi:hypothetical protein QQP08_005990 [Theobroma cacao]|nr:hypothetical protein QQP08_005990 [Theobroma cacao]
MRKGFGLLPGYRSGFVKQLWVPGNCGSNCEIMVLLLQPFRVGFKREIATNEICNLSSFKWRKLDNHL